MTVLFAATTSMAAVAIPAHAASAEPVRADPHDNRLSPIARAEILLDRDHFSPGEIDGNEGDNFRKALQAFQTTHNLPSTGKLDPETWSALVKGAPESLLRDYRISSADVAGPFAKRLSAKLEQMAKLHGLPYRSSVQEIAEKFHMSERLLRRLNPGARFDRAGTVIIVPDVPPMQLRATRYTVEAVPPTKEKAEGRSVATIIVDKSARDLRVYDKDGKLLAFYPATIGSEEKPAPTGTFAVRRVAWNPFYHYDPKFKWKGVHTQRKLTIKPGPKNPVGLVWMDLTAPSYGIHGAPQPGLIGKTESHGCIRLTNWDAVDLASMVHKGTVVKLEDQDFPVTSLSK